MTIRKTSTSHRNEPAREFWSRMATQTIRNRVPLQFLSTMENPVKAMFRSDPRIFVNETDMLTV